MSYFKNEREMINSKFHQPELHTEHLISTQEHRFSTQERLFSTLEEKFFLKSKIECSNYFFTNTAFLRLNSSKSASKLSIVPFTFTFCPFENSSIEVPSANRK